MRTFPAEFCVVLRKVFRFFCFLSVAVSSALASTNEVPQYHSRVWQTDDGLPQNSVQAITQTRDGYLWIGTQQGLARFDGVQFAVFNEKTVPEIKNSYITALCETKDGSLWIATEHGGLNRLLNGKFFHYGTSNGLPSDHALRALYQSKDGALWIGTTNGLCRFQDEKFTVFRQEIGLSNIIVRGISEEGDGALLVATVGGLFSLKNEKASRYVFSSRAALSSIVMRVVHCDRQGRVWVGFAGSGVEVVDGRKITRFAKKDGLADLMVSAICEDKAGTIWVGTYSGLNRLVGDRFVTELTHEGQPFDLVNSIFEDREGNLWVGAKDGLYRLQTKKFTSYTKREGLSHYNVMSVIESRTGPLWIGTWGGQLNQLKDGVISQYEGDDADTKDIFKKHSLSLERILALHEDKQGQLWIGTDFYGGLFQIGGGKVRHYDKTQGLSETAVRVIREDHRGYLWVGTSSGLFVLKKKFFHQLGEKEQYTGTNVVHAIIEDNEDRLWVGTDNGLHHFRGGKSINLTTTNGLSHNAVYSIYEDSQGTLWVGTRGGGLNRMRREPSKTGRRPGAEQFQFTAYTTQQGLFSDDVFEILEDDFGHLWMTCRLGVFCVSKKALDDFDRGAMSTIQCQVYGKTDGMVSVECNSVAKPAAWKSRDGRLWFATARGLVVTDPRLSLEKNETVPPVMIEAVIADKKSVNTAGTEAAASNAANFRMEQFNDLTIQPGRGELEIHYTALSFKHPEKNHFKYKLHGIDSEWVDAGTRRVAYYNHIPPGHYQFQVAGCNSDGVWNSSGMSVNLVLLPHFWQTWWFLGLVGLVAVGTIGGAVRYVSVKNFREKLALLEQQHAVEKERTRIARDMHDDLGARLTEILLLSDCGAQKHKSNPEAADTYTTISDVTREIARNLDALVWAANPRHDALDKMALYIYDYVTKYAGRASIQCDLEVPDELPSIPLSSELRHNILLVVKEALHNIVEHAAASKMAFKLHIERFNLVIAIEDNGKGFSIADTSLFGNGLQNMKKRVETCGGCFDLSSEPGKGTRIRLKIPLKLEKP